VRVGLEEESKEVRGELETGERRHGAGRVWGAGGHSEGLEVAVEPGNLIRGRVIKITHSPAQGQPRKSH
jgi:hypothetical protein